MKKLFTLILLLLTFITYAQNSFVRKSVLDDDQKDFLEKVRNVKTNADSLVFYRKIIETSFNETPLPSNFYLLNTINDWILDLKPPYQTSNFDEVRETFASQNDTINAEFGMTYQLQGKYHYNLRQFDVSLEYYKKGEAILTQIENLEKRELLNLASRMATGYATLGMAEKGIEYTIKVQSIALEINEMRSYAATFNTLGHMLKRYDAFLSMLNFEECIRQIEKHNVSIQYILVNSYMVLAEITQQHEQDNQKALEYLLECEKHIDDPTLPAGTLISFYFTLGDVYSSLNKFSEAERSLNLSDSISISAYGERSPYEPYIKIKRSFHLIRQEKWEDAISLLEETIALFSADPSGFYASVIHDLNLKLAPCYLKTNKYELFSSVVNSEINGLLGFEYTNQTLSKEQIAELSPYSINILWDFFHLKASELDYPEAFPYTTEEALRLLENIGMIFNLTFEENVVSGSLNRNSGMFASLVYPFLGWFSNKDLTSEQTQRLWFNASMGKSYQLVFQVNTKPSEDSLSTEIKRIDNLLSTTSMSDAYKDSLTSIKTKLSNEAFFIQTSPEVATYNFVSLSKAKESFTSRLANWPEKSQILDIYLHDSTLFAFYGNDGDVNLISVQTEELLDDKIQSLLRELKTGNAEIETELPSITKLLERVDPNKELTVIPDKNLYYLPFEVFPLNNKMLVNSLNVKYHYSPYLWFGSQTKPTELKSILLLAPVFSSSEQMFSQATFRELEELDTDFELGVFANDRIVPLPYTLDETNSIGSLFSKYKKEAIILNNEEATKSNLMSYGNSASIIHIATHGVISSTNPNQSRLFLFPEQTALDNDSQEFLFLSEIYNLNFNADLVVLSACKTGTGKLLKGEGIMALPRGFLYAGVPNVIASLWKVHDQKTKDLMVAFYKYLLSGKNYAEALRLAKLECISKGFLPMDWAGFILIGE